MDPNVNANGQGKVGPGRTTACLSPDGGIASFDLGEGIMSQAVDQGWVGLPCMFSVPVPAPPSKPREAQSVILSFSGFGGWSGRWRFAGVMLRKEDES
jgi:hypothetical protein